uniref:ATP-dependent RNA helicase n=1 Tax=Peronospora matthiolae TaxID=2874970 RepID=A0AAV1V4W3_9STRA
MASRAFRQAHIHAKPIDRHEADKGNRNSNNVSTVAAADAAVKQNERERLEIERLEARIAEQTPARGSQLGDATSFDLFPLSENSRRGLRLCGFVTPTKIQVGALPHALAGRDVLAAAKTGSGKTLAFLLPVLEKLFRLRWSVEDGLGALVISPTRELALQIFEVLRNVGKAHTFSAGLVIGGKNFREEQLRLVRMNLLVCTPGRLLQHMEQTPAFDASNLQVLVLDEADRILDLGFQKQLTAILEHLPPAGERQTMLFSATQTKSVKDLAALSLREPEYVAVHEHSTNATPKGLTQSYVVTPLERKLDVLLSFIKSHLKQKTIVFLSTCRQVRYVHSVFCKLQPGIPLCALHGKYKQGKRVEVYYEFLNKPAAVLFATDIAARGLDFPQVDWVLQLDCPEDTANYIHRVGRTARYNKQGKALMCLVPSEVDGMLKRLEAAKVPISETKLNPAKTTSCRQKVASVVAGDKDIKALAQKAFMSYVRSVYLQPDREVFDATALPLDAFAESLGLPGAPRMPFLSKMKAEHEKGGNEALRDELRGKKNVNRKLQQLKEKIKAEKARKRLARQLATMDPKEQEEAINKVETNQEDNELDEVEAEKDSLMVVKRVHNWADDDEPPDLEALDRRKQKKQKRLRVDSEVVNTSKIVFDEDGNSGTIADRLAARNSTSSDFTNVEQHAKEYTEQVAARLAAQDAKDRRLEKERVRAKHHKKRMQVKGERDDDSDDNGPRLAVDSDDDNDDDMSGNRSESDHNDETSSDDDDNNDDNDKKPTIDRQAVASQEAMALRMLQHR